MVVIDLNLLRGNEMLFIAEIGLNHNGNFSLCFELIKQAKQCGADIAKFQVGWRDGPGEMNRITNEVLDQLMKWCDFWDIEFMVSIITRDAYELIKPHNLSRYKIASRTVIDDPDLVKEIVGEGKPTFVSLGMWDRDELPLDAAANVDYLWCRSKYPCEPWDVIDLPKDFDATPYIGYSDHTIGIETALIAITRGANVIEKHFTLDKSDTTIRDHALSATPDEFSQLVDIGRTIRRNLDIGV